MDPLGIRNGCAISVSNTSTNAAAAASVTAHWRSLRFMPTRLDGLAVNRADVALRRPPYDLLAVARHDPPPPGPDDPLERERLERSHDRPDRVLAERNQVRVAVHEAHPGAVGDHLDDVAGEERVASGPVQHLAACEMAAAADEREPVAEIERLAAPVLDVRVGSHHPLAVVLVQVHGAVEP